jgi:hypothetical protein
MRYSINQKAYLGQHRTQYTSVQIAQAMAASPSHNNQHRHPTPNTDTTQTTSTKQTQTQHKPHQQTHTQRKPHPIHTTTNNAHHPDSTPTPQHTLHRGMNTAINSDRPQFRVIIADDFDDLPVLRNTQQPLPYQYRSQRNKHTRTVRPGTLCIPHIRSPNYEPDADRDAPNTVYQLPPPLEHYLPQQHHVSQQRNRERQRTVDNHHIHHPRYGSDTQLHLARPSRSAAPGTDPRTGHNQHGRQRG